MDLCSVSNSYVVRSLEHISSLLSWCLNTQQEYKILIGEHTGFFALFKCVVKYSQHTLWQWMIFSMSSKTFLMSGSRPSAVSNPMSSKTRSDQRPNASEIWLGDTVCVQYHWEPFLFQVYNPEQVLTKTLKH